MALTGTLGGRRRIVIGIAVIALLAIVIGVSIWYMAFREEPQPAWVTDSPEMRFKYGSIGAERDAGIPYWIFYVMPRICADKLPKPGGYASLGVPWEQGQELPVGFTKKVVGFPRVANNCAVCHTATYRITPDETPTFVVAGPGHTTNVEGFFRFLVDCGKDPRFNADNVLAEINDVTELSWIEQLMYRFAVIPLTKQALVEREAQFEWIYRHDFPDWGPGRDDAMNLTKYFMIREPMDDTFGPTDMPAVWNLKKYDNPGTTMNWAGDSHDAYSVIMDSALGLLGAAPKRKDEFLGHVQWLKDYLSAMAPPKFPAAVDPTLVAAGKGVFDRTCAGCHASEKTGARMALAAVGTDDGRLATWGKDAAIAANKVVSDMGLKRDGLVEAPLDGYNPPFLDGIWLRAPYLHNGSVPTLRDLLTPAANRPKVFWRGYDVYDTDNIGFISQGPEAERFGTRTETTLKSGDNRGHEFGVDLAEADKRSLLEYLKSL
jgi:mono/diheme cytochrome c family protein